MAFILVIIVSRDGFALDVAVDVVTWTGLAEPDRRSGSADVSLTVGGRRQTAGKGGKEGSPETGGGGGRTLSLRLIAGGVGRRSNKRAVTAYWDQT